MLPKIQSVSSLAKQKSALNAKTQAGTSKSHREHDQASTIKIGNQTASTILKRLPNPNSSTHTFERSKKRKRSNRKQNRSQNNVSTAYQIEDFYLTKLGINLNKTSKRFENTKKSCLGSIISKQLDNMNSYNKSILNHSQSTNIFAKSTFTLPLDDKDCQPSYGEYVNTMPSEIRLLFHKSANMKNIFKDFDRAYYCLEEVKERVKCYKVELGVVMEKNVINLKKIIDRMLLNASRIINDHKQTNDKITRKNLKEMETVVEEKEFFQRRNKELDQLLDMYKCEREYLEHHMKSLNKEIEYMHERHKNLITKITTEDIFGELNEDRIGKKTESMQKIYADMSDIVGSFSGMLKQWQGTMTTKKGKLMEMEDVLRAMMVGGKTDKAVQVNELELKWGIEDVIQRDVIENQPYNIGFELKTSALALADHPEQLNKVEPKDELQKAIIEDLGKAKAKADESEEEEQSDSEEGEQEGGEKEREGVDAEQQKVEEIVVNRNRRRNVDTWRLPLSMVLFLETAFKTNTLVRVVPWLSLRKIIYSVYKDRLENEEVMETSVFCGNVTMEEFVSYYFMKISKVRRIAETQMLEFVSSLKYYSKIWPRANIFSRLSNLLGISVLPGSIDSSKLNQYDIHTQKFFLWMFKEIQKLSKEIVELSEGYSILPKKTATELFQKTLNFFLNQNETYRVKTSLERESKMYRLEEEGRSVDGLDIDSLMNIMLHEFIEQRRKNMKVLRNQYSRNYNVEKGYISLDDFRKIINNTKDKDLIIDYYKAPYGGYIDMAYLYASTVNASSQKIEMKDFAQACHKFGLDSPFPCVYSKELLIQIDYNAIEAKKKEGKQKGRRGRGRGSRNDRGGPKSPSNGRKSRGPASPSMSKSNSTVNQTPVVMSRNIKQKLAAANKLDNSSGYLNQSGTSDINEEKDHKGLYIDSATTLFAQHYSILRELKAYCTKFKEELTKRDDLESVWRNLDSLMGILDAGCHFLRFPIISKAKKVTNKTIS